jgi:HK97 family phage major capsid protein/HK97 family phage prohead protease
VKHLHRTTTANNAHIAAKEIGGAAVMDAGWIEGYAAVWGNVDLLGEIMQHGCFARSIQQAVPTGSVKLMVKHFRDGGDALEVIGTITQAREDDYGLWVHAELDGEDTAQEMRRRVLQKEVRFLSVGFISLVQDTRELTSDEMQNVLPQRQGKPALIHTEAKLLEVTVTVRPVNESAVITSAKTTPPSDSEVRQQRAIEARAKLAELDQLSREKPPETRSLPSMLRTYEKLFGEAAPVEGKTLKRYGWSMAEDKAKADLFSRYIRGADSGIDVPSIPAALFPTSSLNQETKCVAMPRELCDIILGKVLPMVSTQSPGDELVNLRTESALAGAAFEEPKLLSRLLRIPVKEGIINWPRVRQAAAGAEGSVTEFAEYGGLMIDWTPEGAEAPGQDIAFDQYQIEQHRICGQMQISRTLSARSGTPFEILLALLFRAALGMKAQKAVINGDGIGRPLGVLQAADVVAVDREDAGEVSLADLVELEFSLPDWMRERGMYVVASSLMKAWKKEADAIGSPWLRDILKDGLLNGHPYITTDQTAKGAAGDVVFGDFSQYLLTIEEEFTLFMSPHRDIERGLLRYVCTGHYGGRPIQPRAFAKLKV